MMECFGPAISADTQERNHRFLEEALELVQACGAAQSEAHQLVDYVYGRPVGDPFQEVGGVMITLAALCLAQQLNMHIAGEVELSRIWTKVEQIRAKQAAKPKHSPLPAVPASTDDLTKAAVRVTFVGLHGAMAKIGLGNQTANALWDVLFNDCAAPAPAAPEVWKDLPSCPTGEPIQE
jgi:hypothetical protein